jgi:uncharacterized protein (UPF0264 family)
MPGLLVSVRSIEEAEAALEGGAALIDVKDPGAVTLGSLGRSNNRTIGEVIEWTRGRRPVSAALGELSETPLPYPGRGLAYAKWGLAGCVNQADWQENLVQAAHQLCEIDAHCEPVAVAYGDHQQVHAPSPPEVCAFACRQRWKGFLLDTARKDGKTLLDWLPVCDIARLCKSCREAGAGVALAGSLGFEEIERLLVLEPDWFAVRGAVCRDGIRTATIDPQRVRQLVELIG